MVVDPKTGASKVVILDEKTVAKQVCRDEPFPVLLDGLMFKPVATIGTKQANVKGLFCQGRNEEQVLSSLKANASAFVSFCANSPGDIEYCTLINTEVPIADFTDQHQDALVEYCLSIINC